MTAQALSAGTTKRKPRPLAFQVAFVVAPDEHAVVGEIARLVGVSRQVLLRSMVQAAGARSVAVLDLDELADLALQIAAEQQLVLRPGNRVATEEQVAALRELRRDGAAWGEMLGRLLRGERLLMDKVAEMRERHGLTWTEIARALGVDEWVVRTWDAESRWTRISYNRRPTEPGAARDGNVPDALAQAPQVPTALADLPPVGKAGQAVAVRVTETERAELNAAAARYGASTQALMRGIVAAISRRAA